ncbi:MAG: peptide MFS transporter, partial [Polyangiaceae bacterium]
MSEEKAIPGKELFGHPAGLYVLFFTEAWERFCYYGMRALLALYVAKELCKPDVAPTVLGFTAMQHLLGRIYGHQDNEQFADIIYGLYTAAVYLTPFFGGILADRLLGQRKSVVIGGIVMACGEFMLMKESLFFPAIVTLTIGNGFFKSNISTQVGALYPPGDPRRDRAFNIFYVGINLGAFLSPFVCGTLGEKVGWAWGFGSAGVGLLLGLVVYLWGSRYLAPDQIMQKKAAAATKVETKPFTKGEWARIIALIVLCALNISFWGVYEQQGNSLQFWADSSSDRHVLAWLGSSWEMPATWFQGVNPFFIIFGTPVINWLWKRQAAKGT